MSDQPSQTQQAIDAYRSGDKVTARRILSQVVRQEPGNARAWYLLSQVVDQSDQAVFCLKKVLEIDPSNGQALERLERLQPPPARPVPPAPTKPCPNCGKPLPLNAIYCKYCEQRINVPLKPETIDETLLEKPGKTREYSFRISGTVIILILICVGLVVLYNINRSQSTSAPKATPTMGPINAVNRCQGFVKEHLKAPATAKFQGIFDIDLSRDVSRNGDKFIVSSYVDSQNSFGAMIRTHYVCTVRYLGNDLWSLDDLITEP